LTLLLFVQKKLLFSLPNNAQYLEKASLLKNRDQINNHLEKVKKFHGSDYQNIFDYISMSSEIIRNTIKKYPLEFINIKNATAEWKIQFPPFIKTFYKFLYSKHIIIEQKELYNLYKVENKDFFKENNFDRTILEGLKARIYRTYPSIVRDFYFNTLVKESLKEAFILYNTKLDIEEGIDLMIGFKGQFYAINLYTKTYRSFTGRKKKEIRHEKFKNVKYIEMPVDFKGSEKCGDFFLYGEKELDIIKSYLYNAEY